MYDAVRGYELAAHTATEPPDGAAAAAARRPRPFDPDRSPAPATSVSSGLDREETLALREKARQGHHTLLARLVTVLASAGWTELEEIPAAIDLRGCRPDGQRVIFEAKTLSGDNETAQARSALAQLLEYRLEYGRPEDLLCLAVDGPLSARRAELLERLGIAAIEVAPDALRQLNDAGAEAVAGFVTRSI
jgi:hypothetical protein